MAKRIKLPLEMANGISVRTLEELKENWDLEKVVTYYHNGRLQTWLNDRYYSELAEQVQNLSTVSDTHELQKQLCGIFGMPFTEESTVDVEAVAERNRRLAALRQITDDEEILKNVDKVAFNQEELAELLDEGESVIYLFNNTFSIPLSEKNKKYMGVGEVTAIISSKEPVDFKALNISFQDVKMSGSFEDMKNHIQKELEVAEKACMEGRHKEAFDMFQDLASKENGRAMYFLGEYYSGSFGNSVSEINDKIGFFWHKRGEGRGDVLAGMKIGYSFPSGSPERKEQFNKYFKFVKELADKGDVFAQYEVFKSHTNDWGLIFVDQTEDNIDEAVEYLEKSAEGGDVRSIKLLNESLKQTINIAEIYSEKGSFSKAARWYFKAAEQNAFISTFILAYWYAEGIGVAKDNEISNRFWNRVLNMCNEDPFKFYQIASQYKLGEAGIKKDYVKAIEWYEKAFERGITGAAEEIGKIYRSGYGGVQKNHSKAKTWFKKGADLGDAGCQFWLGRINEEMLEEQKKAETDDNCFITTAVCSSLNKPDDCDELMTMRWYRDKIKSEDADMAELIKEYYRVAPGVVKKIDQETNAPQIYRGLWDNSISKIYHSLKQEEYRDATLRYIDMFEDLCGKFESPLSPDIKKRIQAVRRRKN